MKPTWKIRCRACVMVVMVGMAGCAASPEPFDYHDHKDEKPGPGLFSGDEGGYVIFGEPSKQNPDAEATPTDTD